MPELINWTIPLPMMLYSLAFGYFWGSIPFGVLLSKAFNLGDVRKIGSGNIGATNVLRTGNKKVALLTLLLDMFKGTFPVLIAAQFGLQPALLAGLGAFIGHCFPIWLKFKGGKGVATYIGVLLALSWQSIPIFALVWLGTALISRYSSLAALLASLSTPIALFLMGKGEIAQLFVLLTFILWLRHRENISRLLAGEESKIGKKG